VLEMPPEKLWMPRKGHHDMEREEPDGHLRRLVVVFDQLPLGRPVLLDPLTCRR
jgi:hypothetical protein